MTLFKKLRELVHHNDKIDLDLDDIQATVLRERPEPYYGTHAMVRFDTAEGGRELLKRLLPHIASAEKWWDVKYAWTAAAISYEGLKKLGVPQDSLDSFPESFKVGMAGRAEHLFDVGENDPKHWEKPFGTGQVHLALTIFAENEENWQKALVIAEHELEATKGVTLLMREDFGAQPDSRNSLGYKDMISNPAIEGSGIKPFPGQGPAIKPGEFVLGYPGEAGVPLGMPKPEVLGKNGTFVALRKYHTNAGSFNRYLKENAEYHAARDQQSFIEGRIKHLEGELSHAQVIDIATLTAGDRVVFGATVKLADCATDEERTYQIADYLIVGLYPRSLASIELRDATRTWLAEHQDAAPALRRLVHENLADVERALAAQARDADD